MRKQRNAAFTDEIITEQKEVSADNNNAKTDGTSGLKMKRKNSYFSGYGTENLGSCPASFTWRITSSTDARRHCAFRRDQLGKDRRCCLEQFRPNLLAAVIKSLGSDVVLFAPFADAQSAPGLFLDHKRPGMMLQVFYCKTCFHKIQPPLRQS